MKKINRQSRNQEIVYLHKDGFSYRDIAKILCISKTTVGNVIKSYSEGRIDTKKISDFPTTIPPDNNYTFEVEHEYQEKQIIITVRTKFVNGSEEVGINYKSDPMTIHEQVGLLTYCLEEIKKKQSPLS